MRTSDVLWIDWGQHTRTHSLVDRLGIELVEICEKGPRIWRYFRCVGRTLSYLRGVRPSVVIVTNPSILLCYLMLALRGCYGFRLFSDAHYFGVVASSGNVLHQRLLDFFNSRTDLVIVTNAGHAQLLEKLGASTFVCQDPVPSLPAVSPKATAIPGKSAFLICSFDKDEPYEAAFEAFFDLRNEGFSLYVSGNSMKARSDLSRYDWVRLLGFLPEDEYYRYLRLCDIVVDLTTHEDCLVCGAYEALAAGKPLVVSNSAAIEAYFGSAVVLTENSPAAIRESIREAYARREELILATQLWILENEAHMNRRIEELKALFSPAASRCL